MPVFEIDPAFGEMAVTMGQATWSIPELTQREKAFACLAADVCVRDLDLPFRMHIEMALSNDVPLADVREAILQSSLEAGHTGALLALKRFKEVCIEIGERYPPEDRTADSDRGFEYFSEPTKIGIDAKLSRMWRAIMSAHWTRPGLSLRERAFISLACNVMQGMLEAPFKHHVHLARAAGASDEQIGSLFRFLSEYGFSRSWAALDALARHGVTE
jgi:alkylhydroperoxidase/carboxymuconolactone decarboxylase family protein YurZ